MGSCPDALAPGRQHPWPACNGCQRANASAHGDRAGPCAVPAGLAGNQAPGKAVQPEQGGWTAAQGGGTGALACTGVGRKFHAKTGSSARCACANSYQKKSIWVVPQSKSAPAWPHHNPVTAAAQPPHSRPPQRQGAVGAWHSGNCSGRRSPVLLRRPGRPCALRGWSAGWRRCLPAPRGRFPAHSHGRQWPAPCWRFARPGTPSRLRCGWCG